MNGNRRAGYISPRKAERIQRNKLREQYRKEYFKNKPQRQTVDDQPDIESQLASMNPQELKEVATWINESGFVDMLASLEPKNMQELEAMENLLNFVGQQDEGDWQAGNEWTNAQEIQANPQIKEPDTQTELQKEAQSYNTQTGYQPKKTNSRHNYRRQGLRTQTPLEIAQETLDGPVYPGREPIKEGVDALDTTIRAVPSKLRELAEDAKFGIQIITDKETREIVNIISEYERNPDKAVANNPDNPYIEFLDNNRSLAYTLNLWNTKLDYSRVKDIEMLNEMTVKQREEYYRKKGEIKTIEYFDKHKPLQDFLIGGGIFSFFLDKEYMEAANRLHQDKKEGGIYHYNYKQERDKDGNLVTVKFNRQKEKDLLTVRDKLYRLEEIRTRGVSLTASNLEFFGDTLKDIGESIMITGMTGKAPTPGFSADDVLKQFKHAVKISAWKCLDIANNSVKRMSDEGRIGDKGEYIQTQEGQSFTEALSKSIAEELGSNMLKGYGEAFIKETQKFGRNIFGELQSTLDSNIIKAGKFTDEFYQMLEAGKLDKMIGSFLDNYVEDVLKPVFLLDDIDREKNKGYFKRIKDASVYDKRKLFETITKIAAEEYVTGQISTNEDEPEVKGPQSNLLRRSENQLPDLERAYAIARETGMNANDAINAVDRIRNDEKSFNDLLYAMT